MVFEIQKYAVCRNTVKIKLWRLYAGTDVDCAVIPYAVLGFGIIFAEAGYGTKG